MTVTRVGARLYLIGGCVKDQAENTNCEEVTNTVPALYQTKIK